MMTVTNQARCEQHYEQRYEQWAAPLRGRPGVVRALNIVNHGIVVVFYAAYALLLGWACVSDPWKLAPLVGVTGGCSMRRGPTSAAPSRRSLLAMARASRFRVGIPSRPSPLRQVGSWPACPLPSCCWSRPVRSRFAAFSAACTFRVTLLPVPSLAPLRVRLLLFLRRCSKGLTWGLQPEGACALRKLMP